ncbi:hypothetical protein VTH06DRAFT_5273 [Thermothelomyces fergusii]
MPERRGPLTVVARGVIAWLPAKRFIKPRPVPNLPPQVFNHPVLIYQTASGTADVFLVSLVGRVLRSSKPDWARERAASRALTRRRQITSFHAGESLAGKFRSDAEFRRRQMPIDPAPPHPDNGVRLGLAGGRVWPRESYVSISLFSVPISVLREETSGPWALSPESLAVLDAVVAKLPHLRSWKGAPQRAESRRAEERTKESTGGNEEAVAEEGWTTVVSKKRALSNGQTSPRGQKHRSCNKATASPCAGNCCNV